MTIVLDDLGSTSKLYPFTATRSIVDIRIGILTIREKWELLTGKSIQLRSELNDILDPDAQLIPANLLPTNLLIQAIKDERFNRDLPGKHITLDYPWQIFEFNDAEIRSDYANLTKGRRSQKIDDGNTVINRENIFLEPGAKVQYSILNASTGPIYIGKNAELMEGCMIRGPFAVGECCLVKMGTKIYGATSAGPYSILGGEIKNSVLFGYSNKSHDGYLGDSVVGEWCNLGAGTSTSNLKNTAGPLRFSGIELNNNTPVLRKCGLLMGDYSRAAINTSFNTGSIVGVCCNIFTTGLQEKYLPDFTWGHSTYDLDKAFSDIDNWKQLKGQRINDNEKKILTQLYLKSKIQHA